MSYNLDVSVFRFDAEKDFLPYYKKYKVRPDENATLIDVLRLIKEQDSDFTYSTNKFLPVKLNKVAIFTGVLLKDVFNFFQKDNMIFDPASEFYAVKDLDVDTSDFIKKMQPLAKFMEGNDEKYYHELLPYYYASPTLEFDRDYFGDSFMLFAIFLIKKYPHKRDEILKVAADEHHGVWMHTSIRNSIFTRGNAVSIEENISELKQNILQHVPNANPLTKKEAKRIENLRF